MVGRRRRRELFYNFANRKPAHFCKLDYSLNSASAAASRISFNKHFHMPHSVPSYYTGRQRHSIELKSILGIAELGQRQTHQKRFVIFGLSGSGKTQFCCKFAQDNREQ